MDVKRGTGETRAVSLNALNSSSSKNKIFMLQLRAQASSVSFQLLFFSDIFTYLEIY